MENDPREIDWPEKQVARLDGLIVENSKAIDTVSEELAATDRAVDAHNGRISALENALTAYGIPFGARKNKTDPMGLLGDGAPERLEFSPPIGGGIGCFSPAEDTGRGVDRASDAEKARISGVQAMGREQYERGWSAGLAAAVDEVTSRVQAVFDGATVDRDTLISEVERQVMAAIEQIVVIRRGEEGPVEEEPGPCGCSACVGERARG